MAIYLQYPFLKKNVTSVWSYCDACQYLFKQLIPQSYTDKKISMPLYRVSGVSEEYAAQMDALQETDADIDPVVTRSIQILMHYGVMNASGKINDKMIEQLHSTLPGNQFMELMNARIALSNAAVGGLFKTIWRGYKKVVLFPMRNAFLSLVNVIAQ